MQALSRTLLALARGEASGKLAVCGPDREGSVWLSHGKLVAIELCPREGGTLGDLLEHEEGFDAVRYTEAITDGVPVGPVGRWLVARGIASPDMVRGALRRQFTRRIAQVLGEPRLDLRFEDRKTPAGIALPLGAVLREALEYVLAKLDDDELRKELGVAPLDLVGERSLTEVGLADEAFSWPSASTGGVSPTLDGARLRRAVALKTLGLLGPPLRASFSTLLRKRQQLRAGGSPTVVLGVDTAAGTEDARRALRRWTHTLHPDRFGADAPEGVRHAAAEVMIGLVDAENTVRRLRGPSRS